MHYIYCSEDNMKMHSQGASCISLIRASLIYCVTPTTPVCRPKHDLRPIPPECEIKIWQMVDSSNGCLLLHCTSTYTGCLCLAEWRITYVHISFTRMQEYYTQKWWVMQIWLPVSQTPTIVNRSVVKWLQLHFSTSTPSQHSKTVITWDS